MTTIPVIERGGDVMILEEPELREHYSMNAPGAILSRPAAQVDPLRLTQQLVAVARAIIAAPKVILADEPTGNLHSSQAKEIMEVFKKLNNNSATFSLPEFPGCVPSGPKSSFVYTNPSIPRPAVPLDQR